MAAAAAALLTATPRPSQAVQPITDAGASTRGTFTSAGAAPPRLDDPATAGRRLFEQALDREGIPVSARRMPGGWRLPAVAARCAACHGAEAEGGTEGQVPPPPLRWVRDDADSRARLAAALRAGKGANGQPLHMMMPRFDVSDRDIDDLITHLAALATGRHREAPLLVTLLPVQELMLPDETALLQQLTQCLQPVGADPAGLGWRWQIVRHQGPEDAMRHLRRMLDDSSVFIVLAPSLRGLQSHWPPGREYTADGDALAMRADRPPLLFPLATQPLAPTDALDVHWLFGGPAEQRAAIARAGGDTAANADWVAVPARAAVGNGIGPRSIGALWGEATCRTALSLTAAAWAAPKPFGMSWARWAQMLLSRLPRIETIDGLALEPARSIAVTDWSVWRRDAAGQFQLVQPIVNVSGTR